MGFLRNAGAVLLGCALTLTASADVTITQKTSGSGLGALADGESVVYIKGLKMRTDAQVKGTSSVTLMDLEKRQMVVLNEKKKRAEVFDLTELIAQQQAIAATAVDVSLKATDGKRTIMGEGCQEHDLKIKVSAQGQAEAQGMAFDVLLSGPVCLTKGAPGHEDYQRFYTAAAEGGFFFGDPAAAKAQPAQQKSMTAMYKTLAEAGVAFATDIQVGFDGSGMMAKMLQRLGFTISSEITDISTDPIADSVFEIPSGYKIKNKK